jgi:hypothetical protein
MSTATIENNNNNNNNNVDDVENFANIDEANQQASPTTMTSEEFAKSMEKRLGKFGFLLFYDLNLKLINQKKLI